MEADYTGFSGDENWAREDQELKDAQHDKEGEDKGDSPKRSKRAPKDDDDSSEPSIPSSVSLPSHSTDSTWGLTNKTRAERVLDKI